MLWVVEAVTNSKLAFQNFQKLDNQTVLPNRNKVICLIQVSVRAAFS